ncbi:MAG: 2-C-methyl-D-erythritol 2,4-cyclodiphosphate synthase [Nitrospinota bacterium]
MGLDYRIGHGFDLHRLSRDRPLILCGVKIDHHLGLLGHSDADVATHALSDAILGAAGLYDIGFWFPDSDDKYKNISSLILLGEVVNKIEGNNLRIVNVDITIAIEQPKLRPYIDDMRKKIAKIVKIDSSLANIKATTTERLGHIGSEEAVGAWAVALLSSTS